MANTARTQSSIGIIDLLLAPLRGAYSALYSTTRHNQRLHRIEYLRGLTDAQLACRGLKREDIVRHVYRNI